LVIFVSFSRLAPSLYLTVYLQQIIRKITGSANYVQHYFIVQVENILKGWQEKLYRRMVKSIGMKVDESFRGGSRSTSKNYVGEQNSNYFLRKTKFKAIFGLLHRCSTYLKSASVIHYFHDETETLG